MTDPNQISMADYHAHQARKLRGKTKGRKRRNEDEGRPAKQYGAMPGDDPVVQSCIAFSDGRQPPGVFPAYKMRGLNNE